MDALPTEILGEVLRNAAQPGRGSSVIPESEEARLGANKELATLCLVSRTFRAVAQGLLYGRPYCATPEATSRLLATLVSRPELADAVRELSGPWLTEGEAYVIQRVKWIRRVRLQGMLENGLLECLPATTETLTLSYAQPMSETAPFTQLDAPLPLVPPLAALRALSISGTVGPTWTHLIAHASTTITSLHLLSLHIREPHLPLFIKTFARVAPQLRSLIITPFDSHDPLPNLPFHLLTQVGTLGLSSNALLLPPAGVPAPLALLPPVGSLTTLIALNSLSHRNKGPQRLWNLAEELVQMVRYWPVCRNVRLVVLGDRSLRDEVVGSLAVGGVSARLGKYAWSEGVVEYE